MTDEALLGKKLAAIETYVRELRELADLDAVERDVKEERFVEHTLQIAVQAAQDVAAHIVADDRLGEPRTNRELFALLARHGWLDDGLAAALQQAVGFRNLLVHGYGTVDPALVRRAAEESVGDLLRFVAAIRAALDRG